MKTKLVEPNPAHLKFRKALEGAIKQGGEELQAEEILAIVSHFVGQLVALQDQRKYTMTDVMELVSTNLERGNREVVDNLMNSMGGHA